jgi:hypothetical protein
MTQQYDGVGTPGGPAGAGQTPADEQIKEAAGQARRAAGEAVEQAQQTAGKVVEGAKEQATSQLATQKERAAGSLGSVAAAIRQTGQGLRQQDQDTVGRYADTVADQVERVAGYLRERDVSDVLEDVENLARRQPGLFLGGAVALGFLGTRFLMSSGSRAERRQRALSASSNPGGPDRPGRATYRPGGYGSAGERPAGSGAMTGTLAGAGIGPAAGMGTGASPGSGMGPGTAGDTGMVGGAGAVETERV